ncbi:MAG: hypothetical protein HKN43_07475 [Rhodothermales bacterium]|nr:hypothetical protein [Rhodothermales bacterium]
MSEDQQDLEVDVYAEYSIVSTLHEEMRVILDMEPGLLTTRAASVSDWSVCMQIEHVCLANKMVTSGLLAIATSGTGASRSGNINRLGLILLGRGVIPRGKADAPDQYRPDPESNLDSVRLLFEEVNGRLHKIGEHLDSIAAIREGFEHPYFGILPAPVWIRFMHVHSLHHIKIVRDILAEVDESFTSETV